MYNGPGHSVNSLESTVDSPPFFRPDYGRPESFTPGKFKINLEKTWKTPGILVNLRSIDPDILSAGAPNLGGVAEGQPSFDKGVGVAIIFYALKISLFRVFTLSD